MLSVGFKLAISASERLQAFALPRSATGIGRHMISERTHSLHCTFNHLHTPTYVHKLYKITSCPQT
jgi:hypothetical protein